MWRTYLIYGAKLVLAYIRASKGSATLLTLRFKDLPRIPYRSMRCLLSQSPIRRVEVLRKRCGLPRRRIPIYHSPASLAQQRSAHNPADDPLFRSIIDNPPTPVSVSRRHGPGLIVLGISKTGFASRMLRLTDSYSINPNHSLRPWHMADF